MLDVLLPCSRPTKHHPTTIVNRELKSVRALIQEDERESRFGKWRVIETELDVEAIATITPFRQS